MFMRKFVLVVNSTQLNSRRQSETDEIKRQHRELNPGSPVY